MFRPECGAEGEEGDRVQEIIVELIKGPKILSEEAPVVENKRAYKLS